MARRTSIAVRGIVAPGSRPTRAGALWLACALSVPVFVLLTIVELGWRFWPF